MTDTVTVTEVQTKVVEVVTLGADGNTILNGIVDPVAGDGTDGDFFINTVTTFIFGPKASGIWPAGVDLNGTDGTNGTNGTDGNTVLNGVVDPTTEGVDGDFFINTVTSFIFGPKAAGTWPAGVDLTSPLGEAPVDGTPYARQDADWVSAGTGGGTSWTMTFAQTGVLSTGDMWMADVSSGVQTRNLPASPSVDDEVIIKDDKGNANVFTITVGRNGNTIMDSATDFTLTTVFASVRLKWSGTDWRIVS